MTPPSVSVVVATKDRPELLRSALASLRAHLRPSDELIVVDSASSDPEVRRLAEEAGARVVRLERPGTSLARNAGLQTSTAPIVAFIDDDCIVDEGWSARVEEAFADAAIGFATGRVMGDRPVSLGVSLVVEAEPRRFDGPADPASYGGGSNMAFRREALAAVAGFDEGLGPGTPLRAAEDQDVFWRLGRAGWAGVFDPRIVVTHQQWRSRGQAIRRQFAYGVGAGAVAVKLIRLRAGGWRVLAARVWRDGVAAMFRNLFRGYQSGALAGLLLFSGVLAGAIRAAVTPLRDGRYRANA